MSAPAAILWIVIAALFAIWIAGVILQFMVGWIWLIFALAVVLLFINLLPRRRAAT